MPIAPISQYYVAWKLERKLSISTIASMGFRSS